MNDISEMEGDVLITEISDVFRLGSALLAANTILLYRGQSNFEWGVVPSLYRGVGLVPDLSVVGAQNIESIMVQSFFARAEPYLSFSRRGFLRDLILAQHYGVPTRLLDWSRNPLVALYFAVENDTSDCDGGFIVGGSSGSWTGAIDSHPQAKSAEPEFVTLVPPHLDTRIVAQSAILTIQNQPDLDKFIPLENFEFQERLNFVKKYRIPLEHKRRIYHDLQKMGLSPLSIYPGLQGVGESVRGEWKNRLSINVG